MDLQRTPAQRADARLGDIANRSEKGSAMGLIQAEAKANSDKTARLRLARQARDAAEAALAAEAPAKPARKPRKARIAN
ncbi:MAG: hypothetical protein ABW179_09430 [Methylobacterium sp.]